MVIVRKGIVLGDILAGAAIFRGHALRVGGILSSTQSDISLRRDLRIMIVSITDLLLCPTSFPVPVFFDRNQRASAVNIGHRSVGSEDSRLILDLKKRYHGRLTGVAVAVGVDTLEPKLCSWKGIRVVLAMLDQIDFT
jgi:hypothetical protein